MIGMIEVTEAAFMIRNWDNNQQSGLDAKFISAIESAKEKFFLNPVAFCIWKRETSRIVQAPFAYKT